MHGDQDRHEGPGNDVHEHAQHWVSIRPIGVGEVSPQRDTRIEQSMAEQAPAAQPTGGEGLIGKAAEREEAPGHRRWLDVSGEKNAEQPQRRQSDEDDPEGDGDLDAEGSLGGSC